jgi:hypothetical protein
MTVTELSDKIDTTRQNLTNKLKRNNFNESDLKSIAKAFECDLDIRFINKKTNETL